MILNFFLEGLSTIVNSITALFKDIPDFSFDLSGLNTVVSLLMYMLSKPIVILAISSLVFWLVFQPSMSLIKFIYRKIPGVS